MRVAMGGTFDILHPGHEALLDAAFVLGGDVFIGLTTDAMALQGRPKVAPYKARKQRLEAWLRKRGSTGWTIGPLEDPYGPAASEPFHVTVCGPTIAAIGIAASRRPMTSMIWNETLLPPFN